MSVDLLKGGRGLELALSAAKPPKDPVGKITGCVDISPLAEKELSLAAAR